MDTTSEPKEPLFIILSLFFGGLATTLHDVKSFLQYHSFVFHVIMSAGQWLCYISSFSVGILTIFKYLKNSKSGHQNDI